MAHGLKVLREARLVHVAETRQVRGGTEQRNQHVTRHMVVTEPQAAGSAAMFAAVTQELDLAPAGTRRAISGVLPSQDHGRNLTGVS